MRRPACLQMQASSREAPETRPPPLRADAISAFTRVFDALWSSQTVKPSCFIPRGTGPTNRRGGAPRGEHPRKRRRRKLVCVGCKASADACGPASLARRRVPLHPSACRRSAPLSCERGHQQSSEGFMPRENGGACAIHSAVIPGRHEVASPDSIRRSDGYGFRARGLTPAPRNDDRDMRPRDTRAKGSCSRPRFRIS